MVYHILNGDSLAHKFPDTHIGKHIMVMREALIDGDLSGDNLPDFWQTRAKHLGVPETEYYNRVVSEFEKLMTAPANSEFNLWFEYDLFCQVNMWFVISIINRLPDPKKVFAVYTSHLAKTDKHFWNGFGPATTGELQFCFVDRIPLREADLHLGDGLWNAYKQGNLSALTRLAKNPPAAFPYLLEIIKANVERFPIDGSPGRPERVLEEIIENGVTDFHDVFTEFWKSESIYGFGDTQLRKLYDKVRNKV